MRICVYLISKKIIIVAGTSFFLLLFSCTDFVQIDPPRNELSTGAVFSNDAVAESAIRGVYSALASSNFAGGSGATLSALLGIASDELSNDFDTFADHQDNSLRSTDSYVSSNWSSAYYVIYLSNLAIDGITVSKSLSPTVASRLEGEAKFLRAFCYFYLVNLWGDVPLASTSDYRINKSLSRAPANEIYHQIITDLSEAKELLPADYSVSGGLRTRATKWAAAAMLARVYLYLEQWDSAEAEATSVIDHTELFGLEPNLNDVFLVSSREAIFQFYPTTSGINNSREATLFLPNDFLISLGIPPSYQITEHLLSSFDSDDQRREAWIGDVTLNGVVYTYPTKYKILQSDQQIEFTVLLRIAEQYLIRSEARTHLGRIVGEDSAESDLDLIRNRAGLANISATDGDAMLAAIANERRVEFFSEWGHRWLDLIRTGRANEVLGAIKEDWTPEDMLRPIPQSERDLNTLLTQNSGY